MAAFHLDTTDNFVVIRGIKHGSENPNGVGSRHDQASGCHIGVIIELLNGRHDLFAGLGRNSGILVNDHGNGGMGNTAILGNLFEGSPSFASANHIVFMPPSIFRYQSSLMACLHPVRKAEFVIEPPACFVPEGSLGFALMVGP